MSSGRTTFAAGIVLGAAVGFSIGHVALWGRHSRNDDAAPPFFAASGGEAVTPLRPLQEPPAFFPFDLDQSFSALSESGSAKVSDALHTSPDTVSAGSSGVAASIDSRAASAGTEPSLVVAATEGDRPASPITDDVERLLPPQPTLPNPAPLPLKLPAATPLSEHDAEREEAIRVMVDKELGDAPETQRDVWFDSLKDMSREDAANVLRMWQMFGGPAQSELLPTLEDLNQDLIAKESSPSPGNIQEPSLAVGDASHRLVEQALRMRQRNLRCLELPGFKRQIPILVESADGGTVTKVTRRIDFSPGVLDQTGLPLDWAIDGEGFFEVTDGRDTFYTRAGRWTLDEQHRLVLADSDPPLQLKGDWVVPEETTEIVLSSDGRLSVRVAGPEPGAAPQVLGEVPIVTFLNPAGLEPHSNALFSATKASGQPRPVPADAERRCSLRQGMLELSNVDSDAEYLAIEDLDSLLPR